MAKGYVFRVTGPDHGEVVERDKLEIPPHSGKIWLDGETICLCFPLIDNIQVTGRGPLKIPEHVISFSADEKGITAAEATLHIRQYMMQKGNEALLLAFAEKGTDLAALMQLYKQILS